MTRGHAAQYPAPPPRGRADEPSAPPPPFENPPAMVPPDLEVHREMVAALEKELKQASVDAGMSEVRVNFAREILDHAEREHQANVLRYDSVMVALQEANRSAGAPDGTRDSVPSDQHRQEPAREEAESPPAADDEVAPGGPNSADLRRVVSEADEMQRSSAVLRSKLEADEQRKQVRAARQRREAQEAEERRRKEQETVAKVRPPPAPFVQRNRSEPLPEEDFCSPEYQPPPPMQRNTSWSSTEAAAAEAAEIEKARRQTADPLPFRAGEWQGDGSAPETSVQMNASQPSSPTEAAPIADDVAREELKNNLKAFLPKVHVPREGLNTTQLRLGPGPGELCVPGFCSALCVATAAVGFVQYASPGAPCDPNNVPNIIKSLRKIAIKNHPDRNSVAKVGDLKAAKAKVITQQATSMESLLDEFEHVAVRVYVDVAAGVGDGPSSTTSFVLNRLPLGASTEQLRDLIMEERPELRMRRDQLAVSLTLSPGASEERIPIDGTTLRSWEVTRASVFRVWVPTQPDWMAFTES